MSRRAAWRRSSSEPLEVGEPELDKGPHALLESRLPGELQRLLVALARLARIHALLKSIVPGDEKFLDSLTRVAALHIRTVAVQISTGK
jgi:hypothetical protein